MVKYEKIIDKAKTCKKSVKNEYKLGISTTWSYYFAKTIIKNNKKGVKKIDIEKAPKPKGTYISRQMKKTDYVKQAKYLVGFVKEHKRLPNYLNWGAYKIRPSIYTYMFARIVAYNDKNNKLPKKVKINSKCFTKPIETKNEVYKYFVEKTGKRFTTIDDLLKWMQGRSYGYYFDDQYSNKQVIDRMIAKKGNNCTDSLQFLINMAEEMGYEWKCIHVKCKSSGSGHVRGKFKHKKHTGGKWINRDPASVLNGGAITSIWCSDGALLSENPQWFKDNLNR
jgi:hypothetical protein